MLILLESIWAYKYIWVGSNVGSNVGSDVGSRVGSNVGSVVAPENAPVILLLYSNYKMPYMQG